MGFMDFLSKCANMAKESAINYSNDVQNQKEKYSNKTDRQLQEKYVSKSTTSKERVAIELSLKERGYGSKK